MIQFINGNRSASFNWVLATDSTFNVVCQNDDGTVIDLSTGVSESMEIYPSANKGGTVISITATAGTDVGGHYVLTIPFNQAALSLLSPGTDLYCYTKLEDASNDITFADNPIILRVV